MISEDIPLLRDKRKDVVERGTAGQYTNLMHQEVTAIIEKKRWLTLNLLLAQWGRLHDAIDCCLIPCQSTTLILTYGNILTDNIVGICYVFSYQVSEYLPCSDKVSIGFIIQSGQF